MSDPKSYKVVEREGVGDIERFAVYPFCDEVHEPSPADGRIEVRHNGYVNINMSFRHPVSYDEWQRLAQGVEAAFAIANNGAPADTLRRTCEGCGAVVARASDLHLCGCDSQQNLCRACGDACAAFVA